MRLGWGSVAESKPFGRPVRIYDLVLRDRGVWVAMAARAYDLIETMRFEALDGFVELERHLSRMKASAEAFGFAFNRHDCRNDLQAATFRLTSDARVRLLLAPSGALAIEVRAMPERPAGPVDVALRPLPVAADDPRLRHKTTDRAFLDEARQATGAFEVVFVGEDGLLTEGSFTNIFVPRDGRLVTPRLGSLMPGILRERLIEEGGAAEGDLRPSDLAGEFFIGNSLRGLLPARLISQSHN